MILTLEGLLDDACYDMVTGLLKVGFGVFESSGIGDASGRYSRHL